MKPKYKAGDIIVGRLRFFDERPSEFLIGRILAIGNGKSVMLLPVNGMPRWVDPIKKLTNEEACIWLLEN